MTRIVALPRLPDRPIEGHKGLFGRVVVVGGCERMIGAPVLAGTAALRMGAGLVYLAMPESILHAGLSITPELVGLGLGKSFRSRDGQNLRMAAGSSGVFVVGPGMGMPPLLNRLKFLCQTGSPAVFDADALNGFSWSKTKWWKWIKAPSILTPHPGEMVRLSAFLDVEYARGIPEDDEGRINVAILAAKTFGQIIVLKGHRTVVTDGDRVYVNRTGDSSLSKAGTGDVLSGIIGTLLAQQMDRFDASCAGVWIHGRAGEIAGQTLGRRSVLARDVIDSLPEAIAAYEVQT